MKAKSHDSSEQQSHYAGIDPREFIDLLLGSRLLIVAVTALVLLAGVFYCWATPPIYRADALLQIETPRAALPGMDELSAVLVGGDARALAEVEVIQTRSVVGRVVADRRLDVEAGPARFPLIGGALARMHDPGTSTGALWGVRRFAWGGERIVVDRLSVPEWMEESTLTLIARERGGFELFDEDGRLLGTGKVGEALTTEVSDGEVALFVPELIAEPGTRFNLIKRPFTEVIAELQEQILVSERGKQTGILQVTLKGEDPARIRDIINDLVKAYVRQDVERHSQEAQNMLTFLDAQLPELKKQVETAEGKLGAYKSLKGSAVDISIEGQELLDRATELEKQKAQLQFERSELSQRFTEQHPAMLALRQKFAQVDKVGAELEGQLRKLPDTELASVRLVRDVTVANELYILLLNRAQELRVAKAGEVGNARVLDFAVRPREPISPNIPLVLALSAVLGFFLSVIVVILKKALRRTLDSAESIESSLGLPVYATIPHSVVQAGLGKRRSKGENLPAFLSRIDPGDPAVESLRSLRTSLQFARLAAVNNVVAIHGPTPGIGKSFVAGNLAVLLADVGRNVLLIDADLRKGHLHQTVGVPRSPGLSDVVTGQVQFAEAVLRPSDDGISFLAMGTPPPNPSELLVHGNFIELVRQVSGQYDIVIVDTAPILNLADGIAVGKLAGTNFLVVRGGVNTLQDIKLASGRLKQSDVRVDGVIFNDLSASAARYRYGRYYSIRYDRGKATS